MKAATDNRRVVGVRLAEGDLETLYWAWRQEMAKNAMTPLFSEWLSNLLWEQANAIRHNVGAHAAWDATCKVNRERHRQRQWSVPDDALGPRY